MVGVCRSAVYVANIYDEHHMCMTSELCTVLTDVKRGVPAGGVLVLCGAVAVERVDSRACDGVR